jgi:hypothetical protein
MVNQKLLKTKKIQVMDRQAHEDLVLDALRFLIATWREGEERRGEERFKKREEMKREKDKG